MRRIVIWLASTVTVVVLLFGYHTSTSSDTTAAGTSSTSASAVPSTTKKSSSSSSGKSSSSSSGKSSSSSGTSSSSVTKSFTGDVAQTRWGPVEVKITVTAAKITKVTVLQSPSGNNRDREINDRALPVLVQETVDAQSAKIDMVSGATVTSKGYLTSLQSAVDQAGI